MSASENLFFLSISDREAFAGASHPSSGLQSITSFAHVPGKEPSDAAGELVPVLQGQSGKVLAQVAMPLALASIKAADLKDPAALLASIGKSSGIDSADIRLAVIDKQKGQLLTDGGADGLGSVTGRKDEPLIAAAFNKKADSLLAAAFSKSSILAAQEQVRACGVSDFQLYCRALNVLGALKRRLADGANAKPVLYLDVLPQSTHLFVASRDDLVDLGSVDIGSDAILDQVMSTLGLKFPGSAAKLFYGDVYDFDDHVAQLIQPLAEKARGRFGAFKSKIPDVSYLYASGFPGSRLALLCKPLSDAMGLEPLQVTPHLSASGASLPAYLPAASLGVEHMLNQASISGSVRSFLVNLSQAEQNLAALASSLPATGAATAPAVTPPVPDKPQAVAEPKKPARQQPAPAKPVQKPSKPVAATAAAAPQPKDAKPAAAAVPSVGAASRAERRRRAVEEEPASSGGKNKTVLIGGIVAAVVVLGGAAAMFMGGGSEESAPASSTPVVAPTPAPAPVVQQPVVAPEPEVLVEEEVVMEEPPPPPPAGNISVQSTPVGASVYINGELSGRTPLFLSDLEPGTYEIELRQERFEPIQQTVEVLDEETAQLHNLVMELTTGAAEISSTPRNVPYQIVALDSQAGFRFPSDAQGTTPAVVEGLRPGDYRIQFQRAGWPQYQQEFSVEADGRTKVSFEYQPATARIATEPAGANVSIDGRVAGQTPVSVTDLPEGLTTFVIQLSGYEPETVTLDIPAGETASADLQLLSLDRTIVRPEELDALPALSGSPEVRVPASMAGRQGTAYLRFVVDKSGTVESVTVVRSDVTAANDAVLSAARNWQFSPAERKGFPMRAVVTIPVRVIGQ